MRHVMKSLLADFDILMNVGGFQNVEQIDRSVIGGSSFSSSSSSSSPLPSFLGWGGFAL